MTTAIPAAGTVLITGASRNLGERLAVEVLSASPQRHVIALVRSPADVAERLREASGNPNVHVIRCELSDLASVRDAASSVVRLLQEPGVPPLHALVGNAGIQQTNTSAASADGYELTFAVNVLANQLLIDLLRDHLVAPARIVIVGSGTHYDAGRERMWMVPGPRWARVEVLARPHDGKDGPHEGHGRRAYSTSKLANVYQVHTLARQLPDGIDAYTYDPGLMPGTELIRDAVPVARLVWRTVLHLLRVLPGVTSPEASARHLARVATGPRPAETGAYIALGKERPSSPASYDPTREADLNRAAQHLIELALARSAEPDTDAA